jgi:hypothetical protein
MHACTFNQLSVAASAPCSAEALAQYCAHVNRLRIRTWGLFLRHTLFICARTREVGVHVSSGGNREVSQRAIPLQHLDRASHGSGTHILSPKHSQIQIEYCMHELLCRPRTAT